MPARRRLTPDQVREIRSSAEGCRALGKRFGVSHVSVWKARTLHTHIEVPDEPPSHRSKMTIEVDRADKDYFFDSAREAGIPLRVFIADILHSVAVDDRRESMGVIKDA